MVDLQALETEAFAAAQWGRARMAARAAFVILPVAFASWAISGHVAAVLLGTVLLAVGMGLRFWHRKGVEAVRLGLVMGLVPFATTVLLQVCGVECTPLSGFSEGEIACVLSGAAAGAGVTLRAAGDAATGRTWLLATGVASLTGALGCVPLGVGGLVVTIIALIVSAAVVAIPMRSRFA